MATFKPTSPRNIILMVGMVGVEPTEGLPLQILSLLRLKPIAPHSQFHNLIKLLCISLWQLAHTKIHLSASSLSSSIDLDEKAFQF